MYKKEKIIQSIEEVKCKCNDTDLRKVLNLFQMFVITGETTWCYTFYDDNTDRLKEVKETIKLLCDLINNIEGTKVTCTNKEFCGRTRYQYIFNW